MATFKGKVKNVLPMFFPLRVAPTRIENDFVLIHIRNKGEVGTVKHV